MDNNILIIIPARGGSKGIPRKNLRPLNGKPLIYYAIKNAISLGKKVDCYVSSEDDEILVMATKFGAKTIKRLEEYSSDNVTLDPVISDAFLRISKLEKKTYDIVITLQPTSPLLKQSSIKNAINIVLQENVDTIISGVFDSHLTWIKSEGKYSPNYEKRLNRQQLPEIYKETGGFVVTKSEFVKEDSRFGKIIQIYPLSNREAIDIDNFEDWSLCEYFLKKKKILFVVRGNNKIGMGHVYNTLSIANEILNHEIIFLVDKESNLAFNKIAESNYNVLLQKSNFLCDDILEINPDIVINDILDTSNLYMKALKKQGVTIINFEDLGIGASQANLVVNAMYPEGKIILNHYFGAKYFILRDEFLFTPQKKINKCVKNILVSFGGVDPNDFTDRILTLFDGLVKNSDINITVVVGLGYKNSQKLTKKYSFINLKTNISSMSDEILNADLIFTSAGRTTFEIASIGTPAIVLCQNKRETTHFFASEKNGFYNLGLGSEIDNSTIIEAINTTFVYENRCLMNQRMLDNMLKEGKKNVLQLINIIIEEHEA